MIDNSLKEYTTFKVGGLCKKITLPNSVEELISLLKNNKDSIILGNGSNVLIDDGYIDKEFIITKNLNVITINEEYIEALCGTDISAVCEFAAENNLSGMEFLYKIPGTVGGCTFMNAGAYEKSISDIIFEIKVYDKKNDKVLYIKKDDCNYAYKKSIFMTESNFIILSTTFKLNYSKEDIFTKLKKVKINRENKLPCEFSAGSYFKRPKDGFYASKLIDECNLKGFKIGGAMISPKHAGFIINTGNATTKDILDVAEYAKKVVKEKRNIDLTEEVIFIK